MTIEKDENSLPGSDPDRENVPVMRFNDAGLHILVVGDGPATRGMAILLRRNGHRVRVESHGRSALQAALREPPDVVLFDLALPDMDGREVARRLQQSAWGKTPLLIALGEPRRAEEHRPREAGVHLHLPGPVDAELLRTVLQRFHRIIRGTDRYPGDGRNGGGRGPDEPPFSPGAEGAAVTAWLATTSTTAGATSWTSDH